MERWKDISGHPGYQVSDRGRVRSKINNRHGVGEEYHILKPYANDRGYQSVQLGRGKRFSVHRLVAEEFIDNPKNLPLVRHFDDNPSNNRSDNLVWGTQTDNMQDCVKHGRLVGDTRGAIESRKMSIIATSLKTGERIFFESQQEAARELGVWQQHISSVLRGKIRQTGGWKFEKSEESSHG